MGSCLLHSYFPTLRLPSFIGFSHLRSSSSSFIFFFGHQYFLKVWFVIAAFICVVDEKIMFFFSGGMGVLCNNFYSLIFNNNFASPQQYLFAKYITISGILNFSIFDLTKTIWWPNFQPILSPFHPILTSLITSFFDQKLF